MRLVAVTTLLVACHLRVDPPRKPWPVAIVYPPKPYCINTYPPGPPKDIDLNFQQEDVIIRTTVNYRQYNELLRWARDVMVWIADTNTCLEQLSQDPPPTDPKEDKKP